MWLAPREINDNSLGLSNLTFVFYLPFIFFYLPLSPSEHICLSRLLNAEVHLLFVHFFKCALYFLRRYRRLVVALSAL